MRVTWIILNLNTLDFVRNKDNQIEYYTLDTAVDVAKELNISRFVAIDVTQENGISLPFPLNLMH